MLHRQDKASYSRDYSIDVYVQSVTELFVKNPHGGNAKLLIDQHLESHHALMSIKQKELKIITISAQNIISGHQLKEM